MAYKALDRIHSRNSRPKSEEPVDLLASANVYPVAENGYRWVQGESGLRKPLPGMFLVANPGSSRVVIPPDDLCLEMAQLDPNEESMLAFAAKFGPLGLERRHFHSNETDRIFGESAGHWGLNISEFRFCFDIWQAIERPDLKVLKSMLMDNVFQSIDKRMGARLAADLPKTARGYIVGVINGHLKAWTPANRGKGCFRESCPFKERALPTPDPRYVSYGLRIEESRGKGKVQRHLSASCLLVEAWLQFAELICGKGKIRACDVCGRLMDVFEAARPGSKRMHDRCSRAARMRRYRSKLKDSDS